MTQPKRLLLKLSGELLLSHGIAVIDAAACQRTAQALANLKQNGYQVAAVIGGGNICRGVCFEKRGWRRPAADQMGMLATMMNGLALKEALFALGCPVIHLTALDCPKVADTIRWDSAQAELEQGKIVLFSGGTGNPFFSTDTAAALRASEIQADLLLKATKVEGVFDSDPLTNPHARFYSSINYSEMLAQKLMVMDATAIALCRSCNLAIRVFHMNNIFSPSFPQLLAGGELGTYISGE